MGETITGYLHAQYAKSLAEFGVPQELPRSGGWILTRSIPGVPFRDAMGCYPLFACRNWSHLAADLADLAGDLVCLSVVTDPYGDYDRAQLETCFPDKVILFKRHFCIDLERSMNDYIQHEHRRNAYRALKRLRVERCEDVTAYMEDWSILYEHLIRRHGITGIRAFSRSAFAAQFQVPGLVAFRASYLGATVAMALAYIRDNVAYIHLSACDPLGYKMDASSALYWRLIEHCRDRGLKWLNLGAGAGVRTDGDDGLTRFKRGWSTGTRTAYFCGRIFNRSVYDRIVENKGLHDSVYFPAYRADEFE